MEIKTVHKRILELRPPIVLGVFVVVAVQHFVMRFVELESHLMTEILVYGFGVAGLFWIFLGWVARSVEAAEDANEKQTETSISLARRNRQIEGLYTASRLLAGARTLETVAGSLLEIAVTMSEARGGALTLFAHTYDEGARGKVRAWTYPENEVRSETRVPSDAGQACFSCPDQPQCDLPGHVRCLPISSGPDILGILRLDSPVWGPQTRQSLDTLTKEMIATWWARRTEGRALRAMREIGSSFLQQDTHTRPEERFIALVRAAVGAGAGTLYRIKDDHFQAEASDGASVPAPTDAASVLDGGIGPDTVWADDDGRIVYAMARGESLLALAFDVPRALQASDLGVLRVLASQAGLLFQLTRGFNDVLWQERRRLAGEIHDGLAQVMAYLNLRLQRAIDAGRADRFEDMLTMTGEVSLSLLDAYEDVRNAIDDLRLYPAEGESVEAFLRRQISLAAMQKGMSVKFSASAHFDLPSYVIAQISRITHEAVNNAHDHAQAAHVDVSLNRENGDLVLRISDDGAGFDVDAEPERRHHGLSVMRERAHDIGGSLSIESHPGKGTALTLRVRISNAFSRPAKQPALAEKT